VDDLMVAVYGLHPSVKVCSGQRDLLQIFDAHPHVRLELRYRRLRHVLNVEHTELLEEVAGAEKKLRLLPICRHAEEDAHGLSHFTRSSGRIRERLELLDHAELKLSQALDAPVQRAHRHLVAGAGLITDYTLQRLRCLGIGGGLR
jgi:hypothetical protein